MTDIKNEFGYKAHKIEEIDHEDFGECIRELWTQDGVAHRDQDLPSIIYREIGSDEAFQREFYHHGQLHREGDKPARIFTSAQITAHEYFEYDVPHRAVGPAVYEVTPNGIVSKEEYIIRGQRHREDGKPSIVWRDDNTGRKEVEHYHRYDEFSRLDGPATFSDNGVVISEDWWLAGELYRADGGPTSIVRNAKSGEIIEEKTYSPNKNPEISPSDGPA